MRRVRDDENVKRMVLFIVQNVTIFSLHYYIWLAKVKGILVTFTNGMNHVKL